MKANRRQLQKSQNEIQREIAQLDRREKETLAEIKKLAAKGQVSAMVLLAPFLFFCVSRPHCSILSLPFVNFPSVS